MTSAGTLESLPNNAAMKARIFILFLALALAMASAGATIRDGLLLDLVIPPGEGDRFKRAEFSCWLPDASKPVKAVILHQHGCTSASPTKHPPVTGDWHWRALARKHDAALLVPMYQAAKRCDEWNDPDSGSERALGAALEDFARRSGRAELKDTPWVLWGHSGGSSWSAQMIVRHPERVLAASFRGGCHKQFGDPDFRKKFLAAARGLPLLFVWGKRESVPASSHHVSWEPMNTMFRELRMQGGRVTRVIDPRSEHGCDDSRLMSLNFFDAVLSGQAQPGALADMTTLEDRDANAANRRAAALTWMPNAAFAKLWREFSKTGTLRPQKSPVQAPELQGWRAGDGAVKLAWRIVPELAGGLRAVRVHRDGRLWKEFGIGAADFLGTGRDAAPESLRAQGCTDESRAGHTYTLTFLDAARLESPASPPVRVP